MTTTPSPRHRADAGTRAAPRGWLLVGGGAAALAAGLGATAVLLGRRLVAVTVRGTSMEPTYRDGDRVLVRRDSRFTPGQVVVVERPVPGRGWHRPPLARDSAAHAVTGRDWLIKRVAAAPGDPVPHERIPALAHVPETRVPPGRLVLLGDNPAVSFDSRRVGYFPAERVLGAVLRPLPR
ncbi:MULTISPECIES: S26 family signal peptidase [unclassified Streptomyces]|uniref:S26 family signal peptidase n=1 Tax=unclassified Streptomyces TaxID=2593676 RepID=UPI000998AAA7|nr:MULTISPECIES: S26 family signal peptidase [unclassified Streptomyces]